MDKLDEFILLLLKDNDIALTPYNPSPSEKHLELFNHFNSTDTNASYLSLLDKYNESNDEKFEFALDTIKHYKGMFDHFDTNIEFDLYQKIKPWLSEEAIKKFQQHYYKEYAKAVLADRLCILEQELIDFILLTDIYLYIKIARKLNIPDAGRKIFSKSPYAIYEWLNICQDPYAEMVALNEPMFILNNMSGRLSISPGCLKYIIEYTEPNKELFLSIKRSVGFEKFLELSRGSIDDLFTIELVETLDDLIFVINTPDMSLSAIETILKTTKEKYPHIYDSLDSLLFVKKGFNNK